jgi:hypothetical protein
MAEREQRPNSGILFGNRKKDRPTSPDMTGNLDVDGKPYWISAWNKTSSTGGTFITLSIKAKDDTKAMPLEKKVKNDNEGYTLPWDE